MIIYSIPINASQEELIKSLENDLKYYERVVKPTRVDSSINFLNRIISKYENKGLDDMYLIPVRGKLKNLIEQKGKTTDTKIKEEEKRYPQHKRETSVMEYSKPKRDKREYSTKKTIHKRNSPSNEAIIKVASDNSGRLNISVEGESDSLDIKTGFSVTYEFISRISEKTGMGGGITYQAERGFKEYEEAKFNFIPLYVLLKSYVNSYGASTFYTVHLGFNVFNGNDEFKGEDTLTGGIYYGAGIGFNLGEKSQLELLYSVNTGTIEWPGGYYTYYDPYYGYYSYYEPPYTIDIKYSTVGVVLGLKF